jgi:ankyrin repeat protein
VLETFKALLAQAPDESFCNEYRCFYKEAFLSILKFSEWELLAITYFRHPGFLKDIPVPQVLGVKNGALACRLCFVLFILFRHPVETRRKIFFEMLRRKQRKFIELAFRMEKEEDMVRWRDEGGNTPLLAVCGVRGLTHKFALFLLRQGSEIKARNCDGENCFEMATRLRNKKLQTVLNDFGKK